MTQPGAIAVDLSRLLTGLRFGQPSGVERMELGYAKRLDAGGGGVLLTPLGPRAVTAGARRRIAALAQRRWREDGGAATVRAEADRILNLIDSGRREAVRPVARPSLPFALLADLAGAAFRNPAAALPRHAAYLHASFFRLERERYFAWLERRPDIRAVFILYDLLPLQHPEWFRPGEEALHALRIATAARRGAMIVVAAATVAAELRAYLRRMQLPEPPIHVAQLPVEDAFLAPGGPHGGAAGRPYLLCCGTIEPRKNHRLLLEVWRQLVAARGEAAPCLVIAGRRGWRNDSVFAALDDLGPLAPHVLEVPDLSTGALAILMRGAQALLSPSLGEGYGLPVAEALASGIPALIADTPVYRELWGSAARLIDPHDAAAWANAICALDAPGATAQLNAGPAHAMNWPEHVAWMEGLLAAS
jgi:glycosyltransferase involved in cell wall biosynthesis